MVVKVGPSVPKEGVHPSSSVQLKKRDEFKKSRSEPNELNFTTHVVNKSILMQVDVKRCEAPPSVSRMAIGSAPSALQAADAHIFFGLEGHSPFKNSGIG